MFNYINELDTCEYRFEVFAELLEQTQKVVDEFSFHDYSNFPKWIQTIDEKVEQKLFDRLIAALSLWKQALVRREKEKLKSKQRMRLKVIIKMF